MVSLLGAGQRADTNEHYSGSDINLYARRSGIIPTIGAIVSPITFDIWASVPNTDYWGTSDVGIWLEGTYRCTPELGGVPIHLRDPTLHWKSVSGAEEYRPMLLTRDYWDYNDNSFGGGWYFPTSGIPHPEDCSSMYIEIRTETGGDYYNYDKLPAFMDQYGLRIDLKTGDLTYLRMKRTLE